MYKKSQLTTLLGSLCVPCQSLEDCPRCAIYEVLTNILQEPDEPGIQERPLTLPEARRYIGYTCILKARDGSAVVGLVAEVLLTGQVIVDYGYGLEIEQIRQIVLCCPTCLENMVATELEQILPTTDNQWICPNCQQIIIGPAEPTDEALVQAAAAHIRNM